MKNGIETGILLVQFCECSFTAAAGGVDALWQIHCHQPTNVLNLARARTSRVATAGVTRFRETCPGTTQNLHNRGELVAPVCGELHPVALRFLKTCKNQRLLVTHRTEAEASLNFDTPTTGITRTHGVTRENTVEKILYDPFKAT